MKQILKYLISLVFLSSFGLSYSCCGQITRSAGCCETGSIVGCSPTACANCCDNTYVGPCDGYPFLATRSQSVNAARELVGWQQYINKYDVDSTYGAFSIAVEYTNTFRADQIAKFFFGKDLTFSNYEGSDKSRTLLIQGSNVQNRDSRAWLADYFGLPLDFESRVRFNPYIENVIADMNFYISLDKWMEGAYFRVHAPLVWTKWRLDMCECIENKGVQDMPAGYMSEAAITRSSLAGSFTEAMNGSYIFGDMKEPIKFGIMSNCRLTKTRLSDIQFALGWNWWTDEDGHLGANIRLSAPAGNRPCATFLFEPIVGNGKHWEIGVGLTSSWIFHRSKDHKDRYLGVWFDANLTHILKASQCRSFDFWCKPNGRYMLLEEMIVNSDDADQIKGGLTVDDLTVASYRYATNLIPAINWSTFNVKVSVALQLDAAIKLSYVRDNWDFDAGYNLWYRSGEKFHLKDTCNDCACCPSTEGLFAIKGDAYIYGYTNADVPKALSATQVGADIHTGLNYPSETINPSANLLYIDNPLPAWVGPGNDELDDNDDNRVDTSIQPKLVSKCDLNLGKSPSALTHKLFGHVGYSWKELRENWTPFLGFGGEIEFACIKDCCNDDTCCCAPCTVGCNTCISYCDPCAVNCCPCSCDSCGTTCLNGGTSLVGPCCQPTVTKKGGISQWGFWVKGGVAFD